MNEISFRWLESRNKKGNDLILTFVDSVAQVALPLFTVDEEHERVDVGSAGPASHYRIAGNYR